MPAMIGFLSSALVVLLFTEMPAVSAHGWTSMRNEDGETIESRNSVAWKNGAGYPNPHGMSQTNSPTRPMYCGGLGQTGFSQPEHDLISAPDALKRARESGFATRLRKGSKVTLQNFITANHGGVAALYYACPSASVDTPEEYKSLNWQLLTPIKDSYPENKRNGVGFSDKMPEWYGFAGAICNFGAGYTGGVLQNCDDCQLRYGGPQTTAAWNAQKPPSGAPLGTGQLATIVDIEYQLPEDFECPNAVFSWLWHTPHLCIPKEVADKRAENDFWKFCNRNLEGYYGSCRTEWQDEIFINCMDAEVSANGSAPVPSPSPPSPSPLPSPSPVPGPSASCVPIGDCGVFDWCNQDNYEAWCADQGDACPAPYCKTGIPPSPAPVPSPVPSPTPMPPVPSPTPMPSPSPAGTCVASLEQYYTDPSVWEPYCAQVGAAGVCPAPMCKISASMLAKSKKNHNFLGTSLIQADIGLNHSKLMEEAEEL